MQKKHIIGMAHPMREMLAEVVLGLENFEISEQSKKMIVTNRKTVRKEVETAWRRKISNLISGVILRMQKSIGLINFRFYFRDDCDIAFAHGGFLVTDKPYFTYLEKATQIYGYTGKNYDTWLSKFLLRHFLRDEKLKGIFFLTEAAYKGMLNISSYDDETKDLIRQKGTVVYPPMENLGKSDIDRFLQTKEEIRFLHIASSIYGKGGIEILHAFNRLYKENRHIRLVLVVDTKSVKPEDTEIIRKSRNVEMHDYIFTRKELFDQFLNTSHVFCYPTYSDSFSAVINEAISAYLPIITSDFYSIPERVFDRKNGFVFPSPLPNYDNNFVISEDHFTDQPDFLDRVDAYRIDGRLKYVEDFLYEKMKILSQDSDLRYRMASENKRLYEGTLNPVTIRETVNRLMLNSISKADV